MKGILVKLGIFGSLIGFMFYLGYVEDNVNFVKYEPVKVEFKGIITEGIITTSYLKSDLNENLIKFRGDLSDKVNKESIVNMYYEHYNYDNHNFIMRWIVTALRIEEPEGNYKRLVYEKTQ